MDVSLQSRAEELAGEIATPRDRNGTFEPQLITW
jgi:hypothetical protein